MRPAGARCSRRNGAVRRRRRAGSAVRAPRAGRAGDPRGRRARPPGGPRSSGGRSRVSVVVEGGAGRQGAGEEQLEVVQLARGRAVLGDGSPADDDTGSWSQTPGGYRRRHVWSGSAAVVVAEIVRSGFVEGHHYGSWVALAPTAPSPPRRARCTRPVLPRSCNKPVQALGHARGGSRPRRRAARAGLRLALGRALPRRGRTSDPGRRGPRGGRAADAAGLPARRRGARGRDPPRRDARRRC